jgi:hypothetical protein
MFERIFHPVPAGWNTDAPPKDNPEKKLSAWVLTVMGDVPGMKKQEATALAFTPKLKELCDKYREVKEHFFMVGVLSTTSRLPCITVALLQGKEDVLAGDKSFFVNDEGVLLGNWDKRCSTIKFPNCRSYGEQARKSPLAIP